MLRWLRERIVELTTARTLLRRARRRVGQRLRSPHDRCLAIMETGSGSDGDPLVALERLLLRDGRPAPARPRVTGPTTSCPPLKPVSDRASARGATGPRDPAVGNPCGTERRQSAAPVALQLRYPPRPPEGCRAAARRGPQPGCSSLVTLPLAITRRQSGSTSGASLSWALPDTMSNIRFGGTSMKMPSASAVSSPLA